MKLTPENKEKIDSFSYTELLRRWRFSESGDKWFQGETGRYWGDRMATLRKEGANHVDASKEIGWVK